jgi:ribosomal protein L11 methyltransferase
MSQNIGEKFIVADSFEDSGFSGRIPIVLSKGRAFGSGWHETTRSCLEELEKLPVSCMEHVLDLGCGTGILAIAAARLGAISVTAIDPSPFAVETALANVKRNDVEDRIDVIQGELKDAKGMRFDLIVANLYGDILLEIAPDLPLFLNSNAYLLLSGIHCEYHYEVKTAFLELGLCLLKNRLMAEYATFLFKRKGFPSR